MTVYSLEEVKKVINEIGPDKVKVVFRYLHTRLKETRYAVFMEGEYVNVYRSPFCEDITKIYDINIHGGWLE